MEQIVSTYRQFLEELKKASTGAKFSSELDLLIKDLEVRESHDSIMPQFSGFITFFDTLIEKTRHGITNWDGICNIMAKKGSTKSAKLFFLNDASVAHELTLNVGNIALEQNRHNSLQIRNFVYMCYVQACTLMFEDPGYVANEKTKANYNAICELFGEEEKTLPDPSEATFEDLLNNPNGLVGMYTQMLDDLVRDGLDGPKLCQLVLDNNQNPMLAALLGSAFGNMLDMGAIRSQVEKLDSEDIKAILEQVKEKVKDIDLHSLISSVQNMNPSDLQQTISGLQSSFLDKDD